MRETSKQSQNQQTVRSQSTPPGIPFSKWMNKHSSQVLYNKYKTNISTHYDMSALQPEQYIPTF